MQIFHKFIVPGFTIQRKTKEVGENQVTYYEVTNPKLGKFEINSISELTEDKYNSIVKNT